MKDLVYKARLKEEVGRKKEVGEANYHMSSIPVAVVRRLECSGNVGVVLRDMV